MHDHHDCVMHLMWSHGRCSEVVPLTGALTHWRETGGLALCDSYFVWCEQHSAGGQMSMRDKCADSKVPSKYSDLVAYCCSSPGAVDSGRLLPGTSVCPRRHRTRRPEADRGATLQT